MKKNELEKENSNLELSEEEKKKNKTYKCPECEVCFNLDSLRIHYSKSHKKTSSELCVKLFYNGIEPTCKCGCGGKVYYFGLTIGFGSYVKGHHVREYDKNPWNKEKGIEARRKSNETQMRLCKEGKIKLFGGKEPWNKGKVKATDPDYAARIKFTDTEEFKRKSSEIGKRNWKENKIPVLKGEKSYVWKGGVSSLSKICRASNLLYKKWIYPKLKENNFSCLECGVADSNLEVHHDKEKFSEILRKIAKEEGWLEKHFLSVRLENPDKETLDLKEKIADIVAEYHIQNNVSGIPLCQKCHEKQHKNYNIKKKKSL